MKWITLISVIVLSLGTALAQIPLTVNVIELKGANYDDEIRITRALELIEEVINSHDFASRVLGMKFKVGRRNYRGYSQTSLTPAQVLKSIEMAQENFEGGEDHVIDLFLEMYEEASSTIGYTSPSDKFIHMNRYFHSEYSAVETTGNLFHEWLHKLGHGHSRKYNKYRPHSVPYKLGQIMSEMAAQIESKGDPIIKEMLQKEFNAGLNKDCH